MLGAAWRGEGGGPRQIEQVMLTHIVVLVPLAAQTLCITLELPREPQASGAGRSAACGGWRPHANFTCLLLKGIKGQYFV